MLCNIFLEQIRTDALEEHQGTISISSRAIPILQFADDLDRLGGDEQELANLVSHLDFASSRYGMEINASITKLMTNS